MLQNRFPELIGKVVPVLRDAKVKFKKPAQETISANPSITDESVIKFKDHFEKKGRASILVNVEIKDQEGVITSVGEFNWFIQGHA